MIRAITNSLSVTEHTHSVIRSCSQTLHALRILRRRNAWHEHHRATRSLHSMELLLQGNYVTPPAPGGASRTTDSTWMVLYAIVPQIYIFTGIIDQADEKLFQLVLTNLNHVLSSLLRGAVMVIPTFDLMTLNTCHVFRYAVK